MTKEERRILMGMRRNMQNNVKTINEMIDQKETKMEQPAITGRRWQQLSAEVNQLVVTSACMKETIEEFQLL